MWQDGGGQFPILGAILALPFLGSLIILAIPERHQPLIRWVAATASFLALLLSIWVFRAYPYDQGGYQFQERHAWLPAPVEVSLHLGVDGLSAPLVLLTGIVIFCGVLVSWKLTRRVKDFFILLLVLVGGVFGVFLSLDLFFFFFFYEVAVLPMYLLIAVWGSSTDFGTFQRTKEYSAMKLTLVLVAASVPVWVAFIALFWQAGLGTFNLVEIQQGARFSVEFQRLFFPLVLVGFGVLAGLWPFHTWSPDGHVAAPTAVSMLHAGVLMKLGAFGIIRVGMTLMPEGAQTWMPLLLVLGTVNVVYGALSALAQQDLKYVVGYTSVSHMGYVLVGIATLNMVGLSGAVLQMFSHGIMTALMFALVGAIYDQAHTRVIAGFGGLARRMGIITAFFVLAGLTSLGLPGLSGFIAEVLVFAGLFQRPGALVFGVLAVFGAAITAVYILRLMGTVFFGDLPPRWEGLRDASPSETVAMAILGGLLVAVGLYPASFLRLITRGVADLMAIMGVA
ncbi:MAG: NADH-quinone oxidoreductase subunit M [Chloroflexi bacterium]|nr:NADH-quinone oxidoreductase subunit M [Chloroflexota bacterium]